MSAWNSWMAVSCASAGSSTPSSRRNSRADSISSRTRRARSPWSTTTGSTSKSSFVCASWTAYTRETISSPVLSGKRALTRLRPGSVPVGSQCLLKNPAT
ncbi:hypothetical protein BE18_16355 [Sorangium cellulosum]|uniref:Uncharacterized protein n=1 Tax=Sorangium cellulosum TaxID=56 RepID=A0A150T2I3_SORCE|nr:hypothetical protein BE18_16355 [Sorangium cellulosum]